MSDETKEDLAIRATMRAAIGEVTAQRPAPPAFSDLAERARLEPQAAFRQSAEVDRNNLFIDGRRQLLLAAAVLTAALSSAAWFVASSNDTESVSAVTDSETALEWDGERMAFTCIVVEGSEASDGETAYANRSHPCMAAADGTEFTMWPTVISPVSQMTVSPDGRLLSVPVWLEANQLILDTTGSDFALVTELDSISGEMGWTPDSLAVVGRSEQAVLVVPINGGQVEKYEVGLPVAVDAPEVSSDGAFIAVQVLDPELDFGGPLIVIERATGEIFTVDPLPNPSSFTWAPDTNQLAATTRQGLIVLDEEQWRRSTPLRDIPAEATIVPAPADDGFLGGLTWSPDGSRIAYIDGISLAVVEVTTGNRQQVNTDGLRVASFSPSWSTTSNRIVVGALDPDSPGLANSGLPGTVLAAVDGETLQVEALTPVPNSNEIGAALPNWLTQS